MKYLIIALLINTFIPNCASAEEKERIPFLEFYGKVYNEINEKGGYKYTIEIEEDIRSEREKYEDNAWSTRL